MDKPPTKRRGPLLWLANRSRRVWIVAALIGVPVLYLASFGPACWLVRRRTVRVQDFFTFYEPLLEIAEFDGYPALGTRVWGPYLARGLEWYGARCASDELIVVRICYSRTIDFGMRMTRRIEPIHDWTIHVGAWDFGLREHFRPRHTEIYFGSYETAVDQSITTVAWCCGGALLISAALLAFAVARFIHRPEADRGHDRS